ncbi:MAG TPA: type VII secretion protein EsaA [Lactococcus sp.]|nr:type VII secretion protein EsaA [Lactococcus sp.]
MEKKFVKNVKKKQWLSIGLLTVAVLALIAVFAYLSFNKKTQKTVSKPTIALVNEDKESSFNKKVYNFGRDFVNLVSGDTKYNWQVVSRSVADRAYKDKAVDAVIYIPQNFSHDILTLQDINPIQSQVNYKLQNNQSELSQNLLDDKIMTILRDFNQSIVKMYYASVAGNILEAQNNMNAVIANHGKVLTNLSSQVYGPFQTTNQNYSSVVTAAESLKSANSAWIASQNSFSKSTQGMLDSTSKTFNNQLPRLKQYFDTQKEITDVNLKNGNQAIINQAEEDQKAYFKQFDGLYLDTLNNLSPFYKDEGNGKTSGLFANLQHQVTDYNENIKELRKSLDTQLGALNDNRDDLFKLEARLYEQFFAQKDLKFEDFNKVEDVLRDPKKAEKLARKALAQKITSFNHEDNLNDTAYLSNLKKLLGEIPWEISNYKALFEAMEASGADVSQYKKDLNLIERYGNALQASGEKVPQRQVSFLRDIPTVNTREQSFHQTLNITVPAGKQYELKPLKITGAQVTYNKDGSSIKPEEGEIIDRGNNTLVLYNKSTEGAEEGKKDGKDAAFTIVYDVSLAQSTKANIEFGWGEKNPKENSTSADYTLYPRNEISDYLGGNKFGRIAELLGNIDKAATLITWIYGVPNSSVNRMNTLEDFKNASPKSIYNLYGNMDMSQLEKRLSDSDVKVYQEAGQENIKALIESITALNGNIDDLSKAKDSLNDNQLPEKYFEQNMSELFNWYNNTLASIDRYYKSWKKNDAQTLALKPWQEYNSADVALYQDKAASDDLYKTISELSTSTAQRAEETAKSAHMIKDNADEFNRLVATTQETKTSAEKLLKNTDNLLNDGNSSFNKSEDYNNNFSKVLSNTRSQAADKNQIFNFFAQPFSIKNLTEAVDSIKKEFDWRWLIIFILGLLLDVLGTLVSRVITKKHKKV